MLTPPEAVKRPQRPHRSLRSRHVSEFVTRSAKDLCTAGGLKLASRK